MAKLKLPVGAKYALGISVGVIVWAILGVGVGLVEMYNTAGTQATGTFTFAGNVSNGELANITNGASVYRLEFNTTDLVSPICRITDCIIVPVTNGWNTSVNLSGNLSTAINANASTAALVTAVNNSGITTLTAVSAGGAGNTIILSDNAVNITSSAMSGGTAPNATPSTVMLIARLAVAVVASLGVMIRFME